MRRSLVAALLLAPGVARAQDCASYAMFHTGTVIGQTSFDATGAAVGSTTTTTTAGSGDAATLHAETVDATGRPRGTQDFTVTCADGAVALDMSAYVPAGSTEAYAGWDATLEGSHLVYPATLAAGDALPDGDLTMTLRMKDPSPALPAAMATATIRVGMHDRRVLAAERVTTPAGTFDAWKIAYTTDLQVDGLVKVHHSVSVVEWFVPGVGAARTETSQDGKALGSSELTTLTRP